MEIMETIKSVPSSILVLIIGLFVIGALLFTSGGWTKEFQIFFYGSIFLVLLFALKSKEEKVITMDKAKEIARKRFLLMQQHGNPENIELLPSAVLQYLERGAERVPLLWWVAGMSKRKYFVLGINPFTAKEEKLLEVPIWSPEKIEDKIPAGLFDVLRTYVDLKKGIKEREGIEL